MPGIPSEDACFFGGTPRNYALTIDHIIPLNKGGKTIPENLQVLCRKCNASKSDKVMDI